VSWDNFYKKFGEDFPLPEFTLKHDMGVICFRKILESDKETVEKANFDAVIGWFGPLKGTTHMVARIVDVLSYPWFFGDVQHNDSAKLLVGHTLGRFYVRLGHRIAGSFVISYLK